MERLCALFLIFMAGITAVGGINIYDFCAVTHIELTTALILRMPESNAHFCDESEPWRFTPSAGRQYMISIISYSVGCEYGRMNLYDFQHDLLIGIQTPQYTPCYYGEFKCGNNHCILDTLMCDGYDNCGDNSDESSRSCSWKYTTTSIRTNAMPTTRTSRPSGGSVCDIGEFECDNGLCISYAYKCDGDNDCGDNSDEVHGCYGHNAGVITGGLLASVFFIVFVIALVLARYRWYLRNINSNRGAVIVNTVSAGLDMTTERAYVGSSTPLVPAVHVPPPYLSAPPPYPPSQYDPGYGY